MQTGRDAINALMRKEQSQFVPLHDSPWGDTLTKWIGQGMPKNEKGEAVDPVDHFGFDIAGCGGWFDWHPKMGVSEIVEENAEWKIVRNGSGALLKWWKTHSGTPEHIGFHMDSREVWEKEYRPLVIGSARKRVAEKLKDVRENLAKRKAQGKWTNFGHLFVWEGMRGSLGDYNMYTSLVADPDWIRDYNRVYTDMYKECYKILIEEGGKPDGIWMYEDLGYKDKLFCSPKTLEDLIFPYYKEMVDFFHGYGLPVVLHSCGYQESALPLVVQAGFDGLHPMEVKAGNDIFKFVEKYGDKLAFVGGLDARILESGDRNVIRKGVSDFILGMRKRGARFVYGSDHSLSTNIDYADFLYSLEVYRELARN
ncbi:MAG TPA: uroporphyrinogen decarboxylase family protein [Planctomycetota bacterium]